MLAQTKQFGLLACVMYVGALLTPPCAAAQRVSGSMEFDCHPPLFLKLNLKGLPNDEMLFLYILWGGSARENIERKEPLSEEGGQWCKTPNQCEPLKSTVEFTKFNLDKKASGTYTVEFKDGRKQSGAFSVVRKKQPKPFLCE